jgi:hypothetical protein
MALISCNKNCEVALGSGQIVKDAAATRAVHKRLTKQDCAKQENEDGPLILDD